MPERPGVPSTEDFFKDLSKKQSEWATIYSEAENSLMLSLHTEIEESAQDPAELKEKTERADLLSWYIFYAERAVTADEQKEWFHEKADSLWGLSPLEVIKQGDNHQYTALFNEVLSYGMKKFQLFAVDGFTESLGL